MKLNKTMTIASVVSGANEGWDLYKKARTQYENRFHYTATLKNNQYIYHNFLEWLQEELQPRGVALTSKEQGVRRRYSNPSPQKITIDGHTVSVRIDSEPGGPSKKSIIGSDFATSEAFFSSPTAAGIDAVVKLLEDLTKQKKLEARKVQFFYPSKYGWDTSGLANRLLDSVFLPDSDKSDLIGDLSGFFESEDHYKKIGAPWHRGYMLYGEPGNGKSSIVAAVANHFKFNLYSMPLSTIKDDTELGTYINEMGERSILLIEDIDIFSDSLKRESNYSGPTLNGLLNSLDGVGTPHGLLTFITTNKPEVLPEALIRNGRIDYRLELKAPVASQIEGIFRYAYDEELNGTPKQFENMAAVANILKTNVTSPDDARKALTDGN